MPKCGALGERAGPVERTIASSPLTRLSSSCALMQGTAPRHGSLTFWFNLGELWLSGPVRLRRTGALAVVDLPLQSFALRTTNVGQRGVQPSNRNQGTSRGVAKTPRPAESTVTDKKDRTVPSVSWLVKFGWVSIPLAAHLAAPPPPLCSEMTLVALLRPSRGYAAELLRRSATPRSPLAWLSTSSCPPEHTPSSTTEPPPPPREFRRYAIAITYDGFPFLGFAQQKSDELPSAPVRGTPSVPPTSPLSPPPLASAAPQQQPSSSSSSSSSSSTTTALDDSVVASTTRKLQRPIHPRDVSNPNATSIHYKLTLAFDRLCGGRAGHKNLTVSSRTDSGVHAICNTCHVDIARPLAKKRSSANADANACATGGTVQPPFLSPENVVKGMNFYLKADSTAGTLFSSASSSSSPFSSSNSSSSPSSLHYPKRMHTSLRTATPLTLIGCAVAPSPLWHARFTAYERTYLYRLMSPSSMSASSVIPLAVFERQRATPTGRNLDVAAMQQAAKHLVGTHDFTSFRGSNCVAKSPVGTVTSIQIVESLLVDGLGGGGGDLLKDGYGTCSVFGGGGGGGRAAGTTTNGGSEDAYYGVAPGEATLVTVRITGPTFLYHQVRNMVGTLVDVGLGRLKPAGVLEVLEARDRSRAGKMVTGDALFLVGVKHTGFGLPDEPKTERRLRNYIPRPSEV